MGWARSTIKASLCTEDEIVGTSCHSVQIILRIFCLETIALCATTSSMIRAKAQRDLFGLVSIWQCEVLHCSATDARSGTLGSPTKAFKTS